MLFQNNINIFKQYIKMQSFLILFLSSIFVGFSYEFSNENRFSLWLKEYLITVKNEDHRHRLFENWLSNDEYIEHVNHQNFTYTLGHNKFSGMSQSEYIDYFNLKNIFFDYQHGNKVDTEYVELADSVNWVESGAVTPVKDQGQCGSCWSFSTTGSLEGAYYIKYGKLLSFSEQQLVSCDNFKHGGHDMGCNGGLMDSAFQWIEQNNGLCLESDYSYVSGTTGKSGSCETTCDVVKNSVIHEYNDVAPSSDDAMMSALMQQPVSIAIQADQKEFQLYQSGVFTGSCGVELDHGVLVVGYGSENGEDYYLVKNSWSTSWGDNGYIKLGRGSQYNSGAGQCGMLMQGSYPIV